MASICSELGVDSPTLDSMVQLYSVARDEHYVETGLTVDELGLAGMDAEEMRRTVEGTAE
jgi:hypothetical protein